ncbi:GNAT family N-acetyltransferase [Bradyrhizobium sp. STM 3809]|uniref:GNAT family N-acetyltransferase n=1 Tax=Bradyrhizobium sp. STM 3809 TaxID=551936 RepID=UPI000A06FF25|nr:GNAT family N-acetyltransferase [Bradyrhizobium sp. STM 3809]
MVVFAPGRPCAHQAFEEETKSYGGEIAVDLLELSTERLRLRTPRIEDADAIQSIVTDPRVALTTASIPHPYPDDGARGFILHVQSVASRDRRNLAMVLLDRKDVIGMIGYQIKDMEAELAYIVSPVHWRRGYATEACREIIAYIFGATEAEAVTARAMTANTASEAVLRKAGLRWQSELPVVLPVRSGTFPTSCWRLSRDEFQRL